MEKKSPESGLKRYNYGYVTVAAELLCQKAKLPLPVYVSVPVTQMRAVVVFPQVDQGCSGRQNIT